MASSKASIEAGRGHVVLTTQNMLKNGLDEAAATFKAWGQSIMAVGASIAAAGALVSAPFLKGLETFGAWGKEVTSTMRQTGLSFEELDTILDGVRVTGDELVPAVAKMSEFILAASSGSSEANRALSDMGISLSELQAASQGDKLMMIADGLNSIGDAGLRIARQRDVFGRHGLALKLEGGSAGIRERAARTEYLEGKETPEMLRSSQEYTRAMREMETVVGGIWRSLGAAAAPVMTNFLRMMTEILVVVRQWTEENRPLLTTIFYIADKLILLGGVITGVGMVIYGMSYAITFFGGAVAIVGSALSTFISLASGGFGLLTVLSLTWTALTFPALMAYKVGLLTIAVAKGVYAAATGLATGATGSYTLGLIAAWIWENIASVGVTLLITVLGALVIVIGAVVLALGGFVLFGVAVAFLPTAISLLSGSFSELFQAIGDSTWFQNLSSMFGSVVEAAQTAWGGIKDAFDAGEWGLLWEILKATAELEWEHISAYAVGVFYYWKDVLSDVFDEAWTYMKISFVTIWGEVKALFFDGVAAIASGFTGMVNVIIIALNGMLGTVAQGMNVAIDMINSAIDRLPQSVRNTIGLNTLERVGSGPQLAQLADGGQRFRDMAQAERQSTREQIEGIESQAIANWFDAQAARVERDDALAEGNQARVAELNAELDRLTTDASIAMREAELNRIVPRQPGGREGGGMGGNREHIAGSFSADVIAGFLGATMGAGETRGEREQRLARENLERIREELERRPALAMG